MGLSTPNLSALRVFPPSSVNDRTLEFFEFLKYETKSFRDENTVSKNDLLDAIQKSIKIKQISKIKKIDITKQFEDFMSNLDKILFVKNSEDEITEINWNLIDDFCSLLRLIERSDERKIRWAVYHIFISGNVKISKGKISELLKDFKIKTLEKTLEKIIKTELLAGLDASFDGEQIVFNHKKGDKLVSHYLADAIGEPSRRSPGELEKEILELIDEGSYSNQEISQALLIDEGLVSRTLAKLRKQDKITLSSFGKHGARYFTTNCDNCPFGTTKASCRKDALSYITTSFMQDFGLDLNANDFSSVDTNQALLKIKRIVMIARKEKTAKMERNIGENLESLLSKIVDKFIKLDTMYKKPSANKDYNVQIIPNLSNLPMLYQLGLKKGTQEGIRIIDEMLQFASKSIKKEDRVKIKKHAINQTNGILKNIGIGKTNLK